MLTDADDARSYRGGQGRELAGRACTQRVASFPLQCARVLLRLFRCVLACFTSTKVQILTPEALSARFSGAYFDAYQQMLLTDVRPKQLADDGGPSWRLAIDKATFWQQLPMQEEHAEH